MIGVLQTSLEVLGLELRVGSQNLLARFTSGQLFEDQVYRNARPSEARLSHDDLRPSPDAIPRIHELNCGIGGSIVCPTQRTLELVDDGLRARRRRLGSRRISARLSSGCEPCDLDCNTSRGTRLPHQFAQVTDVYGGLNDFENILADLMSCRPGSRAAIYALGVRPQLLGSLQEAIREYFDVLRARPAPLYDQLALRLAENDLVVTYNYDLGVERSLSVAGLWDIGTGYGFTIGNSKKNSPVEVLKLHGSTNWRALLFGGRLGFGVSHNSLGERPAMFFRSDLEYLGFPDFVDPLCANLRRAASVAAMIMPGLPKDFYFQTSYGQEWTAFWDNLWYRSQQALQKADELTIIGYSMPDADQRARELLLGTANKAIALTLCCGSATARIEQQFRSHGFTHFRHTSTPTFAGFLSDPAP